MTSRIFSAALAGQLLLLAACTDGGPPSPAPFVEGSPTASAPGADPPATPSVDPEEQALLDRARDEGTLSVIVRVGLAGTAALNSAEKQALVAEAQDDLVAELDPAHVSVQTRFKNSAQLTLTVDEEGLSALFASPRVTRVWENESIPLQ